MSRIKKVQHEDAYYIRQAWEDEAEITGQRYIERPFWYEDEETGKTFYDFFGCLGWPSEVSDKDEGLPGYVAIIGVVRPKVEGRLPQDAVFRLMDEFESSDVPTLLETALAMREDFGFGLHPSLMQSFFGDPDRFVAILALLNERQQRKGRSTITIAPFADFYELSPFDHYVRSFRSTLNQDRVRFYFGKGNDILRNRIREFRKNDPAVMAVGGLVHTLLLQTMWMDQFRENVFNVEDSDD